MPIILSSNMHDASAKDLLNAEADAPESRPMLVSTSCPTQETRPLTREKERTRSIFSNLSASRSASRLNDLLSHKASQRECTDGVVARGVNGTDDIPTSGTPAGARVLYPKRMSGSTPELRNLKDMTITTPDIPQAVKHAVEPAPPAQPSAAVAARDNHPRHRTIKSELDILAPASVSTAVDSRPKTKFTTEAVAKDHKSTSLKRRLPNVLSRTRSLRADAQMNNSTTSAPSTPVRTTNKQANGTMMYADLAVRSAQPSQKERSMSRSAFKPSSRTRSEDRVGHDNDNDTDARSKFKKDKKHEKENGVQRDLHPLGQGYKKNNGSGFFGDFKSSSSKAADGLGKAGKGLFSRLTRSTSSNEKVGAGPEEEYDPRILKLPLIQQTRETRIAKSYEHCRDKTEFWMPALPWRCIDYLNGKCEEEGLYRVSGGLTNVRRWRKRFDTELDVNLLDEPELYDASIIASLFKEWIRELPEEIFPKTLQTKIAAALPQEVPGTSPVPQALRDELSNLPPFNYYLLFAITCHLSLLLSHEAKNKMTLDNLYRCFNQSLKLDGRIFYTLVGDWRQCWQGCYTEDDYLRAEYEYLDTPFPQGYAPDPERRATVANIADERAMTSSSGSVASATGRSTPETHRSTTSQTQPSQLAAEDDIRTEPFKQKKHRSSSDVTGLSPMRVRNSVTPY